MDCADVSVRTDDIHAGHGLVGDVVHLLRRDQPDFSDRAIAHEPHHVLQGGAVSRAFDVQNVNVASDRHDDARNPVPCAVGGEAKPNTRQEQRTIAQRDGFTSRDFVDLGGAAHHLCRREEVVERCDTLPSDEARNTVLAGAG